MTDIVFRRAKPAYLTPDAFAEHFAVSRMTAYRLIHTGVIRAHRIGTSFRIPITEVQRYTDATRIKPTSEEKTA